MTTVDEDAFHAICKKMGLPGNCYDASMYKCFVGAYEAAKAKPVVDVERVAKALMNCFKSQFNGHRIPEDAAPDSWTANGDVYSLDMEMMAKAAIAAITQPGDGE